MRTYRIYHPKQTVVLFCIPPSSSKPTEVEVLLNSAWEKTGNRHCRGTAMAISLEYWTSPKVLVGESASVQEARV